MLTYVLLLVPLELLLLLLLPLGVFPRWSASWRMVMLMPKMSGAGRRMQLHAWSNIAETRIRG